MASEQSPRCPVCDEPMRYDETDQRWECTGMTQHCFTVSGKGLGRTLVLVASDSGEDAQLFDVFPWPTP